MSNLNEIREKRIPVQLNNDNKNLRYDLNAFAELEDIYGSLDNIRLALNTGSLKVLRTFLWAGLIHEDEKLTQKQVGSWIDLSDLCLLQVKITEAIGIANPVPGVEEGLLKKKKSRTQMN